MKYAIKIFLYLIVTSAITHAMQTSGSFKTFPIVKDLIIYNETKNSLVNAAKAQFNFDGFSNSKLEFSYELSTVTEKPTFQSAPIIPYRAIDLNYYLHQNKTSNKYRTNFIQNINRLNFNINTNIGDLSIGRMPIAFGVSKSISPNDVLTPIAFNSIDKEDRTGIDALILKKSINDIVLIDAGIITGKNGENENNAYYIRPKIILEKLDLNLSMMKFKNKNLIGVELQHPIKDAGFWADIAYLDNNKSGYKDFFRATSGIDYKFKNTLYLSLEYHYNGASLESNSLYPEDFILLKNYHYIIVSGSYEITPLLISTVQSYENLKDKSNFASMKLDYNLTENSYLGLGSYIGLGHKTKTEFGKYGKIYFSSFRYYF